MQGHRLGIVETLEEIVGGHEVPHLLGVQRLAERIVVTLGQSIGHLPRPAAIGTLVHADELAFLQVAVDRMLVDALANFVLGRLGELPELLRAFVAESLFHFEHVHALARANQTAAAPGSAESDALGLEENDVHAHLGKIQGR